MAAVNKSQGERWPTSEARPSRTKYAKRTSTAAETKGCSVSFNGPVLPPCVMTGAEVPRCAAGNCDHVESPACVHHAPRKSGSERTHLTPLGISCQSRRWRFATVNEPLPIFPYY